jgi:hypothetical protein
VKEESILLVSYVFGEKAVKNRYLRFFIESARRSGTDVVIVGDHPLPFQELPPNVRHVLVTWDHLVDLVKERIFHGQEPGTLRQTEEYYKVNDFKPLFACLFPEQVEGYDWWGPVDNDMILGNLRHFLSGDRLSQYDVISGINHHRSWGPFTLYRNTPVINELFRLAKRPLEEIFATNALRIFDEWGGGDGLSYDAKGPTYESSISGIIEHHGERLGVRWNGFFPFVWDGGCLAESDKENCEECLLIREEPNKQRLVRSCADTSRCPEQVALCHFQHSKQKLDESLTDDSLMAQLLQEGQFKVNFVEGFKQLNASREHSSNAQSDVSSKERALRASTAAAVLGDKKSEKSSAWWEEV